MTAAEFINLLDRAGCAPRQGSGYWSARCPAAGHAHGDKHKSLSITEATDGKILLRCFGRGHSAEEICAALGINLKDLFPTPLVPSRSRAGGKPAPRPAAPPARPAPQAAHDDDNRQARAQGVTLAALAAAKALDPAWLTSEFGIVEHDGKLTIPYRHASGEPARGRGRGALKAKDGTWWAPGDAEQEIVAYGLWRLPAAGAIDELHIVEGESDTWALALHSRATLGVPGASNTATLNSDQARAALARAARIVVHREPDQAGADFSDHVMTILREQKVTSEIRILDLLAAAGVKDVADLHCKTAGDPGGFESELDNAINQARPQYATRTAAWLACCSTAADRVKAPVPVLDFVLPGLLNGTVGILSAASGVGKTLLAQRLALSVAGAAHLDCSLDAGRGICPFRRPAQGGRVVYLTVEDPPQIWTARTQALAAWLLNRHVSQPAFKPIERNALDRALENMIDACLSSSDFQLAQAAKSGTVQFDDEAFSFLTSLAGDARLVVLDNLALLASINEIDNAQCASVMRRLATFAREVGCAVLILAHEAQWAMKDQDAGQAAVRGGTALAAHARWILRLHKKPGAEQIRAEATKLSYIPFPDPFALNLHSVLLRDETNSDRTATSAVAEAWALKQDDSAADPTARRRGKHNGNGNNNGLSHEF